VFDDLAGPDLIDLALNADQLRGAGQTQGLRLDLANPQGPVFNAPVVLFDGPGGRGEKRPSGAAGLWPEPWVDCL